MRPNQRRLRRIIQQGLIYSLLLAMAILGLGGVGFWLIDPNILTLSDGLWLAFTTAATVGFGDVVPSTHASRAFSVVVVLLGLAVLSLNLAAYMAQDLRAGLLAVPLGVQVMVVPVMDAGIVSAMLAPVAFEGPLFVTTIV